MSALLSENTDAADKVSRTPTIIGKTLVDLVTSPDAVTRIEGRAMASDWVAGMQAWLQAEQDRPGDNRGDLLVALANLHIKFHSSVAACVLSDTGANAAQGLVLGLTQAVYIKHFMGVRAHIVKERRA